MRWFRWAYRLLGFLLMAAFAYLIGRSAWDSLEAQDYARLPGIFILGAIMIAFLVRAAKVWFFSGATRTE
jgi:hypothetical protein